jgi:hypothetical protein
VRERPESYPALGNWPGYGYVAPMPGDPPPGGPVPPGAPVPPGGPLPGNGKWLRMSLAVGAIVVVAIACGGVVWTMRSVSSRTPTETLIAWPPPRYVPPPESSSPSCPPAVAGPRTPTGWQPVSSPVGLAVSDCATMLGWEKKCPDGPFGACPIEIMNGTAELRNPVCDRSWRAVSGLDSRNETNDIARKARAKSKLASDIYTSESGRKPTVSLGEPRTLTVDGAPAAEILATVTGIEEDECHGPTALHGVVATTVPGGKGVVVFVVSLGQGYSGAPDPALIGQLIGTLRRG